MISSNLRDKKSFKVFLCTPPAYERNYPPLGTPSLTAFLKSRGIKTYQSDFNIAFYKYFYLKKEKSQHYSSDNYIKNKIKKRVYYWRDLSYRDERVTNYWFQNIPGAAFGFTEKMLSSKNLLRYIDDKKENLFHKFIAKKILPTLKRRKFNMVGISITAPSQAIFSFTLGRIIKKELPGTAVTIGGQWVSFFREELLKRNDFAYFYDYAIYFEGETPLYRLVDALMKNKPLSQAPNLIYKRGNGFTFTKGRSFEDMDKLPCPDFDGLPLSRYAASWVNKARYLTFETSRGCYWNKCIFCVDLPLPKPRYREKNVKLLVEDIKKLKQKYKVKSLLISNAVFSPWQMKRFCQELLKQKIKIKWATFARFEQEFTENLLRLAKKSGCESLSFGLESINQRVLDFCHKGTDSAVIKRIAKEATDVRFDVLYQTMFGLPSETVNEAMDTFLFLRDYPGYYKSMPGFNVYYLTPKNLVFNNPKKYGIEIEKTKRLPFRFFYPFRRTLGNMDNSKAKSLVKCCEIIRQQKIKKGSR